MKSKIFRCSGYELIKTDIVRAQDCYLYDASGKKYIDFESGVWCVGLGHNHPRITQAIINQIKMISHIGYRYTNDIVENAAIEILTTLGITNGKCVFLNSGSEAVEFGIQVARRLSSKPLLLTLSDSYLGAFGSASKKDLAEWFCFDWSSCINCLRNKECDEKCALLVEVPFEKIGGFVFEPGNSSGLVRLPPVGIIQKLIEIIKKSSGIIMANEITTGLGRTGLWYGFNHYSIAPDIVSLGKILGNGYPVSAIAMTEEIADTLLKTEFRYAQSHQDDPLGCAVAKEVVNVIKDEKLIEHSRITGLFFLNALINITEGYEAIKEVRGRGLMIVIEFYDNPDIDLDSIFFNLLERGFIVGYKPVAKILRFYPPLNITHKEVILLLENLNNILNVKIN